MLFIIITPTQTGGRCVLQQQATCLKNETLPSAAADIQHHWAEPQPLINAAHDTYNSCVNPTEEGKGQAVKYYPRVQKNSLEGSAAVEK